MEEVCLHENWRGGESGAARIHGAALGPRHRLAAQPVPLPHVRSQRLCRRVRRQLSLSVCSVALRGRRLLFGQHGPLARGGRWRRLSRRGNIQFGDPALPADTRRQALCASVARERGRATALLALCAADVGSAWERRCSHPRPLGDRPYRLAPRDSSRASVTQRPHDRLPPPQRSSTIWCAGSASGQAWAADVANG